MNEYVNKVIEAATTMHGKIAQDVAPNGGILRCDVCGETFEITTADFAKYLRIGWPMHHGQTMIYSNKPEAEHGKD